VSRLGQWIAATAIGIVLLSAPQAAQAMTVDGAVRDSLTGMPLPGVVVSLVTPGGWARYVALTDVLGRYTFEDVQYDYFVWDNVYYVEVSDATGLLTLGMPSPVLPTDPSLAADYNLTVLHKGAIQGRAVADDTGAPAGEMVVSAYIKLPWLWEKIATTATAADGTYAFPPLPPGTYRLGFAETGTRFVDAFLGGPTLETAGDVALPNGSSASPAAMRLKRRPVITGVVRSKANSEQLVGQPVTLHVYDLKGGVNLHPGWRVLASTVTTVDGGYRFEDLLCAPYRIQVGTASGPYDVRYYPDSPNVEGAATITLGPAQVYHADVSLDWAPHLYGQATPLGAWVNLWRYNTLTHSWDDAGSQTTSQRDGSQSVDGAPFDFDFGPLKMGEYRLSAGATPYQYQYYGDGPIVELGTSLFVGGANKRQDFEVHAGGAIGGSVVATDGTPIPSATVQAFANLPGTSTWRWLPYDYKARVDAQGHWSMNPLAGSYALRVAAPGYRSVYLGGANTPALAELVSLSDQQVLTGLDTTLEAGYNPVVATIATQDTTIAPGSTTTVNGFLYEGPAPLEGPYRIQESTDTVHYRDVGGWVTTIAGSWNWDVSPAQVTWYRVEYQGGFAPEPVSSLPVRIGVAQPGAVVPPVAQPQPSSLSLRAQRSVRKNRKVEVKGTIVPARAVRGTRVRIDTWLYSKKKWRSRRAFYASVYYSGTGYALYRGKQRLGVGTWRLRASVRADETHAAARSGYWRVGVKR
jgi:hypothetical protein